MLIRPLIIKSSSTPSLFCLALFLFHVLPVTINNSSLPALPCSIQNHSVNPEEVWGGGDQFQPTYWILNRTTKLRSDILAFKLLSRNIKGSSVARWLLGATGVMMWIISLLGFTMRAVQRTNPNSFASVLMEAFSVMWSKCCFGGFSNPPGKHLDQSVLFFIPQAITAASVTPYLLLMSRNILLWLQVIWSLATL